jgi:hypothetical protein
MARLIRFVRPMFAAALLVTVTATPASAVTIRDLLNLKAAGLSDDVLIALSERVILAMIDTARRALAAVPQPFDPQADLAMLPQEPIEPPVTENPINEHVVEVPVPYVVEVPVAVPVAVPVVIRDKDRDRHPDGGRSQPVYWGYGGERRPDSWPAARTPPPKGKNRR